MEARVNNWWGSMTMRSDGILHVVFDFDRPPSEQDVGEYLAGRAGLVGNQSPPVLIEVIQMPYVARGVRAGFVAGLAQAPAPCRAVVAADPSHRMMFRTFEMVESVDVPSEVFTTVDRAIAWIHGLDFGSPLGSMAE